MKLLRYFAVWALLGVTAAINVAYFTSTPAATPPVVVAPTPVRIDSWLGIGIEYNADGSYQGAAIIGRAATEHMCETGNDLVVARTQFKPGHTAATMCVPVLSKIKSPAVQQQPKITGLRGQSAA